MNKKTLLSRGFTLIELLVVIAIIGILAAVVIGSLNDARSGGQDASVKQSVANIRSQAELIYNNNNYSYGTVCSDTAVVDLLTAATRVVNGTAFVGTASGVITATGANSLTGDASGRVAACHSDDTRYVAIAPLASVAEFWCVDSTGASKQVASALPTSGDPAYVCP